MPATRTTSTTSAERGAALARFRTVIDTGPGLDGRPRYWANVIEYDGKANFFERWRAGAIDATFVGDDRTSVQAAMLDARHFFDSQLKKWHVIEGKSTAVVTAPDIAAARKRAAAIGFKDPDSIVLQEGAAS